MGRALRRCPSATARIVAAAASMPPILWDAEPSVTVTHREGLLRRAPVVRPATIRISNAEGCNLKCDPLP